MPSTTQATISPLSGRKRTREDSSASIELQKKLSSPHLQRYAPLPEPATILNTEFNNDFHCDRRQLTPKLGRHYPKRQRVETSHTIEKEPPFTRKPPAPDSENILARQTHSSTDRITAAGKPNVDLSPCHICRRKPTVKAELDAFADCERCTKRTCYICIRECLGMVGEDHGVMGEGYGALELSFSTAGEGMGLGGQRKDEWEAMDRALELGDDLGGEGVWEKTREPTHNQMICSRCCVERGTEGEVWCLGCLAAEGSV